MTKKEAVQILAILKAAYPNFYKDMSADEAQGTVSVWSMQFANVSAEIVLMALNKAISTSKYPPTIAEVKEKFSSIHWEAYEMINKHYGMRQLSDEEFARCKMVYEATRPYGYGKNVEPPIYSMLPREIKAKQLGERKG